MNSITVISMVFSAIATIVIAVFTSLNYLIYRELQHKQEKQQ